MKFCPPNPISHGYLVRKFLKIAEKVFHGFGNFFQLVVDIFAHGDQEEIKLFGGIARRLWLWQNDVVHVRGL